MKRIITAFLLFFCAYEIHAQKIVLGTNFVTNFDNREYGDNTFNSSITLFSTRLLPFAGVNWDENHFLIGGIDMRSDFGNTTKFVTDIKPIMYYKYKTDNIVALAGMFSKKEYIGSYSRAFFSDSTNFYSDINSGFLGHYKSTKRKNTYVELGLNWEGMYSIESREMFRVFTAGRFGISNFYMGYAFTLFHFAGSKVNETVSDNVMINPYIGTDFNAFFDFDIRLDFLIAPQRVRRLDIGWSKPCGGQFYFMLTKYGVKLDNTIYFGKGLMPYYYLHGVEGLYAGDRFYSTTKGIYNRTFIGYDKEFLNKTIAIEAGIVFHYDGSALGSQQIIKLSVALEKIINVTKSEKK